MSSTLVYKFRIKNFKCSWLDAERVEPCPDLIVQEVKHSEEYKKVLLEQVHAPARVAFREERARLYPELTVLEDRSADISAQIDVIKSAISEESRRERKKVKPTKEQSDEIKRLSAMRKDLSERIKPYKKACNESEEMQAFSDKQKDAKNFQTRALRAVAGIHWGTYQKIEEAVGKAVATSRGDIEFRGFRGKGGISIHFQNDSVKTVADIFDGKCSLVSMSRPENKSPSSRRVKISSLSVTVGKPHQAKIDCDIVMHREMPGAGRLLWLTLQRERSGPRWEYYALFTVGAIELPERNSTGKVAAVTLSYNDTKGEIGAIVREDGTKEILQLPEKLIRAFSHEEPRSRADAESDTLREFLAGWIKDVGDGAPEWLRTDGQYMKQWKSHKKMERLIRHWSTNRFSGDEGIFERVNGSKSAHEGKWNPPPASRTHIKHLDDWYACEQAKALARRKDIYRCWAKRLATVFDVVVMQDPELKKKSEQDSPIKQLGTNRQNFALSEFKEAVSQACKKHGSVFVYSKVGYANPEEELLSIARRERLGGAGSEATARDDQPSEPVIESAQRSAA